MVWEAEGHLKVTAMKGEELERIIESPRSSMRHRSLDQYRSSVRANHIMRLEQRARLCVAVHNYVMLGVGLTTTTLS